MQKILFAFLVMAFSFSSFSADYRIQKVKVLGTMKNKVIFQSADLKKIRGQNLLKGKLVAQWGVHVFEVVNGLYSCNKSNYCKLVDYERVATFEKCIVKNKTKVECRKKIVGDSYSGNSNGDVIIADDPDSVKDDMHRDRYSNDEYSEFPVRVNGEFDDIQF